MSYTTFTRYPTATSHTLMPLNFGVFAALFPMTCVSPPPHFYHHPLPVSFRSTSVYILSRLVAFVSLSVRPFPFSSHVCDLRTAVPCRHTNEQSNSPALITAPCSPRYAVLCRAGACLPACSYLWQAEIYMHAGGVHAKEHFLRHRTALVGLYAALTFLLALSSKMNLAAHSSAA
eukprot:COSAG06_NODE_12208_length_1410_cov_1.167811_1_plen_174_part_10